MRYDSDADVVFVILRDPEGGERLDERRYAHFDQADHVFAYEFLFVSAGVALEGIDAQDASLIRGPSIRSGNSRSPDRASGPRPGR